MLGAAFLARDLARRVAADLERRGLIGILTFAGVLLYFPMSYWTLLGMETGILSLMLLASMLFGLRWLRSRRRADLALMAVAAGVAFLTRNDSIILVAILCVFLGFVRWRQDRNASVVGAAAGALLLLGLFIAAQEAFRYAYYGALVPNTYVLKLTRYPLNVRLIDGARYVIAFLGQTWPIFALATASLWPPLQRMRLLLFVMMLAVLAYQVYVGGDPWVTWRMLTPGMPMLLGLAAIGAIRVAARIPRLTTKRAGGSAAVLLIGAALVIADLPFLSDMSVRGPTSAAIANRTNTNSAVAIMALTRPGASIGVIWAGTLPYYADRKAIDYLGKSDAHIAGLKADVSGASGWGSQISIPGHNKYDLQYSIVERRPTYSQAFAWGYATVRPYFVQNYARVEYHGAAGTKTIFLLKDSPLVCWDACRDQYRIVPWPK